MSVQPTQSGADLISGLFLCRLSPSLASSLAAWKRSRPSSGSTSVIILALSQCRHYFFRFLSFNHRLNGVVPALLHVKVRTPSVRDTLLLLLPHYLAGPDGGGLPRRLGSFRLPGSSGGEMSKMPEAAASAHRPGHDTRATRHGNRYGGAELT